MHWALLCYPKHGHSALVAYLYPSRGLTDGGAAKIGRLQTEEITEAIHQS